MSRLLKQIAPHNSAPGAVVTPCLVCGTTNDVGTTEKMKNTDFLVNDEVEELDGPEIKKGGITSTDTSDRGSARGK